MTTPLGFAQGYRGIRWGKGWDGKGIPPCEGPNRLCRCGDAFPGCFLLVFGGRRDVAIHQQVQFSFRDPELPNSALRANRYFREHKHGGLIDVNQSWEMDEHLCRKGPIRI